MNLTIKTFSLFCLLSFCFSTQAFAQKYGHLNLGELLSDLPASIAANKQLLAEKEKMEQALKADFEAFQEKYTAAMQAVQQGTITPNQIKERETALAKEQEELAKKEQNLSVELENKRQELLGPILKKAEEAVKIVAKEKGYKMIFDSSIMNAILYLEEADDVMPLVKQQLEKM